MKHITLITLTLTLAFVLAACAGSAAPVPASAPDTYTSPSLDTTYEDALAARNQLALGTLELAETPDAVTPEQAQTLLPLWQALLATQRSGAAAQAEVAALLTQIEAAYTAEQLAALGALQLTQADLQAWAAANGVTLGNGGGGNGQGQGMSAEARATRQAEEGRTPGAGSTGGASTALLDAVITYLESLNR